WLRRRRLVFERREKLLHTFDDRQIRDVPRATGRLPNRRETRSRRHVDNTRKGTKRLLVRALWRGIQRRGTDRTALHANSPYELQNTSGDSALKLDHSPII